MIRLFGYQPPERPKDPDAIGIAEASVEEIQDLEAQATASKAHNAFFTTPRDPQDHHEVGLGGIVEGEVKYENAKTTTVVERVAHKEPVLASDVKPDYESRKEMLEAEMERRKSVPLATRGNYKPKMKHVSNADIPREPLTARIALKDPEAYKEALGIESGTLGLRSEFFYHSPLNGKTYKDSTGEVHTVHHAVSTSEDRSTDASPMARVLTDSQSGESIFYGSRPDTEARAVQQGEDIFKTEFAKGSVNGKGMYIKPDSDVIELTYVVDSLTTLAAIRKPTGFDERASFLAEREVLEGLSSETTPREIEIDGKTYKVLFKPIHTHHTMSMFRELGRVASDDISGADLERETWKSANRQICTLLSHVYMSDFGTDERKEFAKDLYAQLKRDDLEVHEKLMLTDMASRFLNLPIVHHCKSIVDRTGVAAAVGVANHYVLKSGDFSKIPRNAAGRFEPQLLIKDPHYQELFVAALNMQHQVSQESRMGMLPDGTPTGRPTLGLQLNGGLKSMRGALPFFPDSAVKQNKNWKARLFVVLTQVTAVLLYPLYLLAVGVAAIAIRCKTGRFQWGVTNSLAALPFSISPIRTASLDLSVGFDNKSHIMNGDDRHLNHSAKLTQPLTSDPRGGLFPEHLRENLDEGVWESVDIVPVERDLSLISDDKGRDTPPDSGVEDTPPGTPVGTPTDPKAKSFMPVDHAQADLVEISLEGED